MTIEQDVKATRRMVAWITAIVVIVFLAIVMAAVGFYIEGQRQTKMDSVMVCIENPGLC